MSEDMLFSVLRMPFDLAMANELSRAQYHARGVEAADKLAALHTENKRITLEYAALKKYDGEMQKNANEMIANAENEIAELKAKINQWEEKARQWILSDDAKKQLAGYREMGDQIAALRAESERKDKVIEALVEAIKHRVQCESDKIETHYHWAGCKICPDCSLCTALDAAKKTKSPDCHGDVK